MRNRKLDVEKIVFFEIRWCLGSAGFLTDIRKSVSKKHLLNFEENQYRQRQ